MYLFIFSVLSAVDHPLVYTIVSEQIIERGDDDNKRSIDSLDCLFTING